jgi:hypothetical protein
MRRLISQARLAIDTGGPVFDVGGPVLDTGGPVEYMLRVNQRKGGRERLRFCYPDTSSATRLVPQARLTQSPTMSDLPGSTRRGPGSPICWGRGRPRSGHWGPG